MGFDRERFLDDYEKSFEVRRLYVNLYRECYAYELKTNKKKPFFDQYGYIESEKRYATTDDLEPLYFGKVVNASYYIASIRGLEDSMLHPDVMDAKYVHIHMARHGYDLPKEKRKDKYYDVLFSKEGGQLKSNDEINHWKKVEFPKTYHRKYDKTITCEDGNTCDNGTHFLYNKAEDVLKAYGATDLIEGLRKKKIVFFTGSGISQESGIPTFRDTNGLWEQYPVSMVASVNGWYSDPTFVNDFYNDLRQRYLNIDSNGEIGIKPNSAHKSIVKLAHSGTIENVNDSNGYDYDVVIITQNVDNLHEQSVLDYETSIHINDEDDTENIPDTNTEIETSYLYSYDDNDKYPNIGEFDCFDCECGCCDDDSYDLTYDDKIDKIEPYVSELGIKIIHLHGELMKMCVDGYKEDKNYQIQFPYKNRYTLPSKTTVGEIWKNAPSEYTSRRMRPHVVFFGEKVPNMTSAINEVLDCDIFVVIGTSLGVYPAAELLSHVPFGVPIIYIDPNPTPVNRPIKNIRTTASTGMKELFNNWKKYVK